MEAKAGTPTPATSTKSSTARSMPRGPACASRSCACRRRRRCRGTTITTCRTRSTCSQGELRIFLQDPAKRPHLVTNGGEQSVSFLVLQGVGEYDYVPLVMPK